jgi:hypothetical protein
VNYNTQIQAEKVKKQPNTQLLKFELRRQSSAKIEVNSIKKSPYHLN